MGTFTFEKMPSDGGKRKKADDDGKKAKKAKKDPNAPKRPPSGYLLYCNENREELQKAKPDLNFGQITSGLALEWNTLSDKKKEKYTQEAAKLREAYEEELKNYTPDPAFLAAKTSAKAAKDEPKETVAPRSSWLIFCDEHREKVQAENPGKGLAVIAAHLADRWQNLNQTGKAKFEAMAAAEASKPKEKKVASKPKKEPTDYKKLAKAAGKEQEALRKEKVKKLKAKAKDLKLHIAAVEKTIKTAEKMAAKLDEKKEELEKQEAKLEALCPKKSK